MSDHDPPRIALGLSPRVPSHALVDLWNHLPKKLTNRLTEVFAFQFGKEGTTIDALPERCKLFLSPKDRGYGGNLKTILAYARERAFDLVVLLHDEHLAPDDLEQALSASLRHRGESVTLAFHPRSTFAEKCCLFATNRILHVSLPTYAPQILAIPKRSLQNVNFILNTDGSEFDTELIIQFRAAREPIAALHLSHKSHIARRKRAGWKTIRSALRYRAHQLHLIRAGNYLPFGPVQYSLKRSPYSSHEKIVAMVPPNARVLDIGCSQGLLAQALKGKGATITGVDLLPKGALPAEVDHYIECDLDHMHELHLKREYDVIICADILEHLRDADAVLKIIKRYLKVDGCLIASTGNVAVWFYRLSLLFGRFEYGPRGILDFTHTHLYTCRSFARLFEHADFNIVAKSYTSLPFEVVFQSTGRSRLIKTIDRCYHVLATWWPRLFAYQVVIKAEVQTLAASQGEGALVA